MREADEIVCRLKGGCGEAHLSVGFACARFVVELMKGNRESYGIFWELFKLGRLLGSREMPAYSWQVNINRGMQLSRFFYKINALYIIFKIFCLLFILCDQGSSSD